MFRVQPADSQPPSWAGVAGGQRMGRSGAGTTRGIYAPTKVGSRKPKVGSRKQ